MNSERNENNEIDDTDNTAAETGDTPKRKRRTGSALKLGSRTDGYFFDPFDLCIIGGKNLPEAEQGPYDTADTPDTNPEVPHDLLAPIDPTFQASVEATGVDGAVLISRVEGVNCVLGGRTRVRAARIANRERAATGAPLIKVFCRVSVTTSVPQRVGIRHRENYGRKEFTTAERMRDALVAMSIGTPPEDAARNVGINKRRFDALLKIYQDGSKQLQKAFDHGMTESVALKLAAMTDLDKQREAVEEWKANGGQMTVREARKKTAAANHKPDRTGYTRTDVKNLLVRARTLVKGENFYAGLVAGMEAVLGIKIDSRVKDAMKIKIDEDESGDDKKKPGKGRKSSK